MTQEVLAAGPRAHPRGRKGMPAALIWVVGVVALVVLTAASLAVIADFTVRTVEAEQLITRVEASELAMQTAQADFDSVLADYDVETMTEAEREKLLERLGEVAARGEASIAYAGEQVAVVPIVPWHTNILRAQEAYLAHNAAWVDYLAAASAEPTEWFRPQPAVNDTFAAAKEPLIMAIPRWDVLDLLARVALIYSDGGGESADGQTGGGNTA